MKIKIWGCRGSLTTPGRHTLRYGGNTTCVEVRTNDGRVIVLDAGSGARNLGKLLSGDQDLSEVTFLFTHTHWDHLCGFPFFSPAYAARFRINICGGPSVQDSIRRYLEQQMEPPYFPLDFHYLKARFRFGCSCGTAECPAKLTGVNGSLRCFSFPLNHPNGGFAFKLVENGKSFVFLTDNELRVHHEGGLSRDEYVKRCAGADLLFCDAQYTEQDYQSKRGWGHSTYHDAVDLALEAGVKRLGLFHHDPDRSDDDLDRQVQLCQRRIATAKGQTECFACAEEMVLEL